MLAILEFIFGSFWVWLGLLILISVFCNGIAAIVTAMRYKDNADLINLIKGP